MPPPSRSPSRGGRVGFSGIGRSTPMACQDGGLATVERREPASSDRLPVHRSESPTGYSSAGCSPAEPASASPVTENISSIPNPATQSNALLNFRAGRRPAFACGTCARRVRRPECHLYFARRVSFLSCADTRGRDRKFADSPLEQSGFELWVPPACDAPGSHKVRCGLRAGGKGIRILSPI
jgi:hypothetical protein